MKADILTLKALFQKDVRYIIPTFQRPYVWNQEDQWEPLWNDVRNTPRPTAPAPGSAAHVRKAGTRRPHGYAG